MLYASRIVPVLMVAICLTGSLSRQAFSEEPVVRIYPVADLVVVPNEKDRSSRLETLLKLITENVSPDSWQQQGGAGHVTTHEKSLSLVVRQTPAGHEDLVSFIQQLRDLHDLQISIRFQLLTVPSQVAEQWERATVFTAAEKAEKLAALEKQAVGERLSAPMITCFNGEHAIVSSTELPWGRGVAEFQLNCQPVANKEKTQVQLKCAAYQGSVSAAAIFAATQIVDVPDGGMLVLKVPVTTSGTGNYFRDFLDTDVLRDQGISVKSTREDRLLVIVTPVLISGADDVAQLEVTQPQP